MKKESKSSQVAKEKVEKKIEEKVIETSSADKTETTSPNMEGKVGLLLKEVRKKQGKTLPDIAQYLCIRRVYLAAIEDSDYENIPEYPYGIGFIRSYADYLGLNGADIVQMYKEEAEANFRKNNPYFVIEPQVEATVPSRKYLMISLVAIVAVYFAWTAYNKIRAPETDVSSVDEVVNTETTDDEQANFPLKVEDYSISSEASASEEKLPVVDVSASTDNNSQIVVKETSFVEVEPQKILTDAPADIITPAKDEKGLVVKVKEDTWVEVKNDSKLYLSKVLKPGESYTLPNDSNLKLSVGKADGVEILYNGKPVYTVSPNKKMNISVDGILATANH